MAKRKTAAECCEPKPFEEQREERRERRQLAELRAMLAQSMLHIDRLEKENEVLYGLEDREQVKAWEMPKRAKIGEATAVLSWSDWHPEQVVTLQETNGLNEWGPEHCERAVKLMLRKTCDTMLPRYRQNAKIEQITVWAGGDMLEGYLRDENLVHNAMTPIRAAQFVEDLLERALRTLADNSGAKVIDVVTSTGNHGRTTEKMWKSGRNDMSYETIVYDHLRKTFKNHRKIRWHAEQGEMTYYGIYDWNCRFVHGDSIKYRGGRDGLSSPAMIQIRKWNDQKWADFSFFGDKHSYLWNDQGGFVANGALCGYSAYSLAYGRTTPCQAFSVVDRDRGLTDSTKIFCR